VVILQKALASSNILEHCLRTYVYLTIPLLRPGVFNETCRGFDRRYGRLHRQYELLELRKKMRCPSVGRVDHCPCSDNASVSVDRDPTVVASL